MTIFQVNSIHCISTLCFIEFSYFTPLKKCLYPSDLHCQLYFIFFTRFPLGKTENFHHFIRFFIHLCTLHFSKLLHSHGSYPIFPYQVRLLILKYMGQFLIVEIIRFIVFCDFLKLVRFATLY